jgi:hypothetical protein
MARGQSSASGVVGLAGRRLALAVASVAAVLGAGVAALQVELPGRFGVAAAGIVACWLVFLRWPWAVLPVDILGGAVLAGMLSDGHVRTVVATHSAILFAGAAAVVSRRILGLDQGPVRRTVADLPMAMLAVVTVAAAVYGLARGNAPAEVAVATYQLLIIPTYFFLSIYSIPDPWRVRAAGMLYLIVAAAITVSEATAPGRHGGLFSILALPPLFVLIERTPGWRRAGAVTLAAIFGADIALAAYRGLWVAGAVTVAILAVRATPVLRRGAVAVSVAAGVLLISAIALNSDIRVRALTLSDALRRSPGYRVPEATVGLRVFAAHPLTGAGLGQTTPGVYLPDFMVTNVGPLYHVFYVMILANVGLIGLVALIWPLLRSVRVGLAATDGLALGFAALTCGFAVTALVGGPTDGHWELGLLPALILLTAQPDRPRPDRVG